MYYPLLKSRQAELKAWQRLFSHAQSITPVIRMVEPSDEESAKKYVQHLNLWIEASAERTIAVTVDPESVGLLQTSLQELSPRARIRLAVPIAHCKKLWDAVEDVNSEFGAGVVVICSPEQLKGIDWVVQKQNRMQLSVLLKLPKIDGSVELQSQFASFLVSGVIDKGVEDLIYYGASYPSDNTGMLYDQVTAVPREEWQIYCELNAKHRLSFSDAGPLADADVGPGGRGSSGKVTPAIRYSTTDAWMVHRGKREGWDSWKQQVVSLAKEIVEAPYYDGDYFSWGDKELKSIANGSEAIPGNWSGLRPIELNHHLTLAARQTAAIAAESTSPVTPQEVDGR